MRLRRFENWSIVTIRIVQIHPFGLTRDILCSQIYTHFSWVCIGLHVLNGHKPYSYNIMPANSFGNRCSVLKKLSETSTYCFIIKTSLPSFSRVAINETIIEAIAEWNFDTIPITVDIHTYFINAHNRTMFRFKTHRVSSKQASLDLLWMKLIIESWDYKQVSALVSKGPLDKPERLVDARNGCHRRVTWGYQDPPGRLETLASEI